MTPAESHEVTLITTREQLARSIARLSRLASDATETIAHQRQEKQQLEKRVADLTKLTQQERSNNEQRESLIASFESERAERAKEFGELEARLNDQERLLAEQLEAISHLETELANRAMQIREQQSTGTAWKREIEEWESKVQRLEVRLADVEAERDKLKKEFYEREREEAQYAVRMTQEGREIAAKAIDSLIDQLTVLETRIQLTQA
jgi:chromosome segregation ATPase